MDSNRVKAAHRSQPECDVVRGERGASAVEFAIIASVLFMVVFGTIQFGIAYNRYQGLQAAAREGARIASIGGSQSDVASRVRAAQSLFTGSDVQIRIDYSTDQGSSWPGTQNVCDDASGSKKCTSTSPPWPCQTAGKGSLIKVTATVPGTSKYAIFIPLWGSKNVTYQADGVFNCEKS